MELITFVALFSGVLQIAGYLIYIRKSLRHEIEPNAATWFMFSYGVLLLGVLEWDRGAEWTLLVLPAVCATLSTVVAFLCWRRGTLRWPKDWEDKSAFLTDVTLTVGYAGAWLFLGLHLITGEGREYANLAFLICSNATTLTAFSPLLRGAYKNPTCEHHFPWTVWALAYVALGIATYLQSGFWTEMMIYPFSNAILHGLVACFSHPYRHKKFKAISAQWTAPH